MFTPLPPLPLSPSSPKSSPLPHRITTSGHRDLMVKPEELLSPPPPSLTRIHKGPHVYAHFLGEWGCLGALVSGRYPEKARKRGVLVTTYGNQYPR